MFSLYKFSIWKKMMRVKSCHHLSMFGSWFDCCLPLGQWQASWSYLFSNMKYLAVQQPCLFEAWEWWQFCVFSLSSYSSDFVSTFPVLFLYFCSGNSYIPKSLDTHSCLTRCSLSMAILALLRMHSPGKGQTERPLLKSCFSVVESA